MRMLAAAPSLMEMRWSVSENTTSNSAECVEAMAGSTVPAMHTPQEARSSACSAPSSSPREVTSGRSTLQSRRCSASWGRVRSVSSSLDKFCAPEPSETTRMRFLSKTAFHSTTASSPSILRRGCVNGMVRRKRTKGKGESREERKKGEQQQSKYKIAVKRVRKQGAEKQVEMRDECMCARGTGLYP